MNILLQAHQESRDTLLSTLIATLSADERFVAAWLTGSFGQNNQDAMSDLDLTMVVSDLYREGLCKRVEQVSSQTTKERLDLFSIFGTPAILHENNNNAPEGGTFTFTLYKNSRLMVDWTLCPQANALRPEQSLLLFEKVAIPVAPAQQPIDSADERAKEAAESVAFFWMMMAVTVKYLIRKDQVFVTVWFEELYRMEQTVERLIEGKAWVYQRGSRSIFEPTIAGQKQAILKLGEKMESLLPAISNMGGHVMASPLNEIKALLGFVTVEE